jgi:hypothetical protein
MKIVTVLKTSESYKKEYVDLIYDQCKKFAPDIEFVCISNDPTVPGYKEMINDFPKWWPKVELFRIPGPVLYFDIDTVLVRDIDTIIQEAMKHEFVCLRDFYKEKDNLQRTIGSGVMFWNKDMSYLYDKFMEAPDKYMKECTTTRWWGDQGFIEMNLKETPVFWQDIVPNKVVSWKVHCKFGIPKEVSIIAFHGRPRPWEVTLPKII